MTSTTSHTHPFTHTPSHTPLHTHTQVLAELLPGSHERLVAFVSEGGHVVVLELLTGDIPWLVMPTLRVCVGEGG